MPVLSRLRKRMYSCYSLQLPVSCVFLFRAHTPGLYTHVLKKKKALSNLFTSSAHFLNVLLSFLTPFIAFLAPRPAQPTPRSAPIVPGVLPGVSPLAVLFTMAVVGVGAGRGCCPGRLLA